MDGEVLGGLTQLFEETPVGDGYFSLVETEVSQALNKLEHAEETEAEGEARVLDEMELRRLQVERLRKALLDAGFVGPMPGDEAKVRMIADHIVNSQGIRDLEYGIQVAMHMGAQNSRGGRVSPLDAAFLAIVHDKMQRMAK